MAADLTIPKVPLAQNDPPQHYLSKISYLIFSKIIIYVSAQWRAELPGVNCSEGESKSLFAFWELVHGSNNDNSIVWIILLLNPTFQYEYISLLF